MSDTTDNYEKEIEHFIDIDAHKSLLVLNKGTDRNPDYTIGGLDDFKRNLIPKLKFIHKKVVEEKDNEITELECELIARQFRYAAHKKEVEEKDAEIERLRRSLSFAQTEANKVGAMEEWASGRRSEIEGLTKALQGLVELKKYKDLKGKDAFYLQEQPLAWEQAYEALKPKE